MTFLPPFLTDLRHHDTASPSSGPDLGDLPEWNLDDLYPGIGSERLERDPVEPVSIRPLGGPDQRYFSKD